MDHLGMTRLGVAASRGDEEEVKRLLTTDDVLERDVYGNTAAHYAIANYMITTTTTLANTCVLVLENPEILRIPNKKKQTVAHIIDGEALQRADAYECTCERCPNREITEFLDKRPVTCYLLECRAYELPGISPLNKSILKMHGGITDEVSKCMPEEIGKADMFGNNACHYAAYRDCKGMMKMLMQRSTDKNVMQAVNKMGQRPIDIIKSGELLIADGVTDARRTYKNERGCDDCSLKDSLMCKECE